MAVGLEYAVKLGLDKARQELAQFEAEVSKSMGRAFGKPSGGAGAPLKGMKAAVKSDMESLELIASQSARKLETVFSKALSNPQIKTAATELKRTIGSAIMGSISSGESSAKIREMISRHLYEGKKQVETLVKSVPATPGPVDTAALLRSGTRGLDDPLKKLTDPVLLQTMTAARAKAEKDISEIVSNASGRNKATVKNEIEAIRAAYLQQADAAVAAQRTIRQQNELTEKQQKRARRIESSADRFVSFVSRANEMDVEKLKHGDAKATAANALRKFESDIAQIKARSGDMSVADAQMELQLAQRRYNLEMRSAKQTDADIERANAAKNARMGQVNFRLFMVQQGVEDYQAAGIRGAANNIAAIASTLPGPTGQIALVALMGYSALKMSGALDELGAATERTAKKLKDNYLDAVKEAGAAHLEATGNMKNARGIFGGEEDWKATDAQIIITQRHLDEALAEYNAKKRAFEDVGKGLLSKYAGGSEEAAQEGIDESKKSLDELYKQRKKIEAQKRFEIISKEALGDMDAFNAATNNVRDSIRTIFDEPPDEAAKIKDRFAKFLAEAEAFKAKRQAVLEGQIAAFQEDPDQVAADRNIRDFLRTFKKEELEFQKKIAEEAAKAKKEFEDATKHIKENSKYMEKTKDAAGKLTSDLESQIESQKRLIEQDRERVVLLQRQRQEARYALADRAYGSRTQITSLAYSERGAEIQRQAAAAMRQNQAAQEAFNRNGPQHLQAEGNAWFQARGEAIQRRLEWLQERNTQLERDSQRVLADQQERELSARAARAGQAAQGAGQRGNLAEQNHFLEQQIGLLRQLEDFQRGRIGQGSVQEAMELYRRAGGTGGAIDRVQAQQAALAQRQLRNDENALNNFNTLLEQATRWKEQLANIRGVSDAEVQQAKALRSEIEAAARAKAVMMGAQEREHNQFGLAPIQPRAAGGPVVAGQPYWVGEQGPELIFPAMNGNVMNAGASQQYARALASTLVTSSVATNYNTNTANKVTVVAAPQQGLGTVMNQALQRQKLSSIRRG